MNYTVSEIEQVILDAGSDSLAVFGGSFEGGIHIQQVPDELAACISAIIDSGEAVKSILEIGAASGGTTYIFNYFFVPDRIVLVDDNQHPKACLRPDILKDVSRQEIIGNSRGLSVIEQVEGPFDLVIVDGDHSYYGVSTDVENYSTLLREGGFLVLHDTTTRTWGCAVPDYVAELKAKDDVEFVGEYISQKYPTQCGIALFRKVSE